MSHCTEKRRRRVAVLACTLALAALAAAYLFGCPASPLARKPTPIDLSAFATKEEILALRDEGLSLFGGLESGLVRRIDGLREDVRRHRSEDNAKLSANDMESFRLIAGLRKDVVGLRERLDAEGRRDRDQLRGVARGNQVLRSDVESLRAHLAKLGQLWLAHRCPEPCRCIGHTPTAPTKVIPAVAPLSSVYTFPYPWFYEKPRACPR